MPLYDQVELFCQAILSRGRQEADRILSQAREQAARLVAAEESRRQEEISRTQAQVQAQTSLSARNREDRAALQSKRQIAEAKEALLAEIFRQGLARLLAFRQTPDYPEWLRGRLVKAIQELGGDGFKVIAHPEETGWLTEELLNQVGQETGCHLKLEMDADTPPGGFIALRADGRMRLDQTFKGIINRQQERLRTELAKVLWGGEKV
jgi:vacuolar-type H+-ATPase subunit E/Vma4